MRIAVGCLRNWLSQMRRWPSNVVRIIHWLPCIWKDRDWDHAYLWRMMRFKLARMEKMIREHGHHLYNERDADQIKVAVVLLDRIIAADYGMKEHEAFDEKWGKLIHVHDPENPLSVVMQHSKVTPENEAEADAELRRVFEHAQYMEEQDWKALWKHIEKYGRHWWD